MLPMPPARALCNNSSSCLHRKECSNSAIWLWRRPLRIAGETTVAFHRAQPIPREALTPLLRHLHGQKGHTGGGRHQPGLRRGGAHAPLPGHQRWHSGPKKLPVQGAGGTPDQGHCGRRIPVHGRRQKRHPGGASCAGLRSERELRLPSRGHASGSLLQRQGRRHSGSRMRSGEET